jgi:Tol biopolymer transport system component
MLVRFSHAQAVPVLGARVVGLNVPAQDAILLYDVELNFARRVVLGEEAHTLWGFSPDGCTLLATLDERLVTASLDGSNVRELLPVGSGRVYEPSWSPTSDQIAFTWTQGSGEDTKTYIALVEAQGGTPTRLSATSNEATPRWSPDGTQVAYVSYEQRVAGADLFATAIPTTPPLDGQVVEPPTLLNEADLWVANTTTGERTRITNFPTGNVSMPRWSPDGTLLSFVYSPAGNQDLVWIIANQANAIPTQLSFDYTTVLDTTWLPQGTHLIASLMGMQGVGENRLWQLPLDGRAETAAVPYLDSLFLTSADYPRFSADGTWFASRTAYALSLVEVATLEQVLLDERWALGNTPPVWMPSGYVGENACTR